MPPNTKTLAERQLEMRQRMTAQFTVAIPRRVECPGCGAVVGIYSKRLERHMNTKLRDLCKWSGRLW